MTSRQKPSGSATRQRLVSVSEGRGSIVSPSLIKRKWPPRPSASRGGGPKDFVEGVPRPAEHPYQQVQVIDMHQGTRTLPQTHSTPPWCQQRVSDRWPFGGAFVLRTAVCPSVEGSGMS
jgi:hypothetical protein